MMFDNDYDIFVYGNKQFDWRKLNGVVEFKLPRFHTDFLWVESGRLGIQRELYRLNFCNTVALVCDGICFILAHFRFEFLNKSNRKDED